MAVLHSSYCSTVTSQCYGYMDWLQCCLYNIGWETVDLHAVASVLLHHSVMDTWTDCSVVCTILGEKRWICMQLLHYCCITVLWVYGLIVVFLVHGRGKMSVLLAVTLLLLHHSVMDTWTDCSVVCTILGEKRWICMQLLQYCYITVLWIHGLTAVFLVQYRERKCSSACSYCITVISHCYWYINWL